MGPKVLLVFLDHSGVVLKLVVVGWCRVVFVQLAMSVSETHLCFRLLDWARDSSPLGFLDGLWYVVGAWAWIVCFLDLPGVFGW